MGARTNGDDEASMRAAAQRAGYVLMQRELETGERDWTWRQDADCRHPCFATREQALDYMQGLSRSVEAYFDGADEPIAPSLTLA
jgi:ribosome maturation factor RimP